MKIPKSIIVGGHKIDIRILNDVSTSGEFNNKRGIINLNGDQSWKDDIMEEALLHEIFEAIINYNELNIDHPTLTILSEQLFAVIKNNKLNFAEDK